MSALLILIGIVAVIVFYVLSLYNQFVTIKTRVGASIQEIGNQLKRQADLIPNLVASVKGYMKHEKAIFDELTEARKAVMKAVDLGDPQKMIDVGNRLQAALAPIRAVFESTPQLQAAGPTSKLMDELRDTADKVMYARRTLIDLAADYNIKVVTFPSNIVAMIFGFKAEAGLKMPSESEGDFAAVSAESTKAPGVEL
ncbi:LemA family protein [Candidatus Shapirobacteria bacterium]|nr:LemA family protein [Candidatus Shapirobacteria bacterium]